jgi:hypothetical protein
MRRIEEVFSKDIHLKTKDPLSLSLEILGISREFGEPIEKKNIYETDGPKKRVELSFDLKKEIDKFTIAKISFDLIGESNSEGFLDIRLKGEFQTTMTSVGPISRTFNEYYQSEILNFHKREFSMIRDIGYEIEKRINKLK